MLSVTIVRTLALRQMHILLSILLDALVHPMRLLKRPLILCMQYHRGVIRRCSLIDSIPLWLFRLVKRSVSRWYDSHTLYSLLRISQNIHALVILKILLQIRLVHIVTESALNILLGI